MSLFHGVPGIPDGPYGPSGPPRRWSFARRASRPVRTLVLLGLAVVVALGLFGAGSAGAEDTHVLLPEPTEKLNEGVPLNCGKLACTPGAFGRIHRLAVAGDRVWVGSEGAGRAREGSYEIDGFEAGSPWGFVGPQLDPEGGLAEIGSGGLAVGDAGSEEEVYTDSELPGPQGVVGVYGASSGKLLGTPWTGVHTKNKSFGGPDNVDGTVSGVAVDRSSNPFTEGDVYVATYANYGGSAYSVVSVFAKPSGANGEEPEVVATLKGTCAKTGESCGSAPVPFIDPLGVAVSPANGDVLVVDASAVTHRPVIDVFEPAASHEYVYVGQITGPPGATFGTLVGMAVDPVSGEIYVASTSSSSGVVDQFSGEGVFLGRITGPGEGLFNELAGVGVGPGGDVFVAEHAGRVDVFGPDVVIPDVETGSATASIDGEGDVSAVLSGAVDPLGEGEAKCWFAWGTSEAFGEPDAKCEPEGVADVNKYEPVRSMVRGLAPDTTYHYRLQASNHNGVNTGEALQDQEFHTPGPGVHGEFVGDVSATAASLSAKIDPNGAETSYFFQYTDAGSTSACGLTAEGVSEGCSTAPAAPGEMLPAGGGSDDDVSDHVQGLTPGTTYHYRVVAVSDLKVESGVFRPVAFAGPDHTFTTQPAGASAVLPDGRAWELVTPPDKHGATLYRPIDSEGIAMLASLSGDALTFAFESPSERGAAGFSEVEQALAVRGSDGGWSSRDIATPHGSAVGAAFGGSAEYKFFSPDLGLALVEPRGPFTSLEPEVFPPDTGRTPYLRHDLTCASESGKGTCYEPVVTGEEGYSDVLPTADFNGVEETKTRARETNGVVNVIGASPDLQHVIVKSEVQLTNVVTPAGGRELYEWSASKPPSERLELVSLNEENRPAPNGALLGYEEPGAEQDARGAVSGDGSMVFWTEEHGGLFVRDTAKGVSLRLDQVKEGKGYGTVEPVFQGASANGSRVFFTDTQQLTSDSDAEAGKPDLYVCEIGEVEGRLECALTDLTPKNEHKEAGSVQRVMTGFSEDGSWAYFVANGVLPGTASEGAKPGSCVNSESVPGATCNLYVAHYDGSGWEQARLVAVLSGDDFADWSGVDLANLSGLTAGVSPDGRWLAFVSDRELTGYDNHDAGSGEPDEEVFLYHASLEGTGRLVCASCDPSGARPEGVEYQRVPKNGLVEGDTSVFAPTQWFAASLPGYVSFQLNKAWYRPRYLSDSGRLFFDSSAALVPQDTNDNQSVYEYEPVGVGGSSGCSTDLSIYVASAEGCVGLISSGTAAGESAFVDASENGDDVFFMTSARLTGQDVDNAFDIYDAHVCSVGSPCRVEESAPPVCLTADACRAAPSVEPEVFGAPASTVVSGPGNLSAAGSTVSTPAPAKTVKPRTRAQKLEEALKACRKSRVKKKRLACERSARARYGSSGNSKRGRKTSVQGQGKSVGGRSGR